MNTQMDTTQQSTYDAVFQHPVARDLRWNDVRSMLEALADDCKDDRNGVVEFTRNGHTLTAYAPRRRDFSDIGQLMQIRDFLASSTESTAGHVPEDAHMLVVIDDREARIYTAEMNGPIPDRIVSVDPRGSHRYLHNLDRDSNGPQTPELKSFCAAIAKCLKSAKQILIFGHWTSSSSPMQYLLAELVMNHPDLAARIIGTEIIGPRRLTEAQLLTTAREFYLSRPLQRPVP